MNGIKIIDRKLLADFAKEIVVGGDMLERLVEIQHRFERLTAMGDDEYRGLYIEVPRPTPEEWGGRGIDRFRGI